jgi:hypothetical protein
MSFLKSLARSLALTALGLSFTACAGYRLGADKPAELAEIQTIAIPLVKNSTLEPRSSALVTNHLIRQFQTDPTYKITKEDNADAVLRVTIDSFERRQLRGVRSNTLKSRELEIRLWLSYVLEGRNGKKLVSGTAQGSTSMFLDPNFQLSERQAIDEAARKASEEVLSRIAEGW